MAFTKKTPEAEESGPYRVKHLLARDSGKMLSRTLNEHAAAGWRFVFMVSHKDDLYLTFVSADYDASHLARGASGAMSMPLAPA